MEKMEWLYTTTFMKNNITKKTKQFLSAMLTNNK